MCVHQVFRGCVYVEKLVAVSIHLDAKRIFVTGLIKQLTTDNIAWIDSTSGCFSKSYQLPVKPRCPAAIHDVINY
jgi:hypothetical protein